MRYVSSIPPTTPSLDTRQVKGLSAVYAVKQVNAGDHVVQNLTHQKPNQETTQLLGQHPQRIIPTEDRRKICRRVSHQSVLVELRSGIDRRRHNLRGQDLVDHIDEKA